MKKCSPMRQEVYYYPGKGIDALKNEIKSYLDRGFYKSKNEIAGNLPEGRPRENRGRDTHPWERLSSSVDANGKLGLREALEYAYALKD